MYASPNSCGAFALLLAGDFQLATDSFGKKKKKSSLGNVYTKGGSTLVTLPRIVTPYRNSVDGTRDHVKYQKLVTW